MEKQSIIFMLCTIVLIASPVVTGQDQGPKALKSWYAKLPQMKQRVTQLHFYLQDIVSGPNPTNIPVVIANFTTHSPTFFGLIGAIDDPLTSGPSPDSEIIGRAQGLVVSASLEEISYHMTISLVFTAGEFNGSSLSLVGHNPFFHELRELPIVGGSGIFRLARGSALLNTVTLNSTGGNAVVEYNVVVLHY